MTDKEIAIKMTVGALQAGAIVFPKCDTPETMDEARTINDERIRMIATFYRDALAALGN